MSKMNQVWNCLPGFYVKLFSQKKRNERIWLLQKKTQKFFIFGRAVAESKWSSYDFYIGSIDFIWDKIVKMFWWGFGGPTINCFVGVANVVDFFHPQEFAKDQNCWRGCYQLFEDAAWLLALLNSSEAKGLGQSSFWKEKKPHKFVYNYQLFVYNIIE